MRKITEIIIHCSATAEGRSYTIKDIEQWHLQRGFQMIGYHYVINLDGSISKGRPLSMAGAHCQGHNANSIGICYVGGLDRDGKPKDTRTAAQKASLRFLIQDLQTQYPGLTVHGHNDYAAKECPCFKVPDEL